ncbi:MAG: ribosome-associated translation inhibitor RaiA [Candidatus Latescibacteria bacterium]|nr:ribosome-associated translation inhibitor RaiA [Candidatus Latescibacterota bacterium]
MNSRIEGKNCRVSDATREHIQKHTDKLAKIWDPIIDCEVIVEETRQQRMAEFIVKVPHQTLVASAEVEGDNLFKAIDTAYKRVESQLKRYQGKQTAHR